MVAASTPTSPAGIIRLLVRPGVALLLCLLAGLLAYGPALGGTLIWDDFYLVRENPFFRSPVFGLEVFRHYLFFDSFSTYYRPVQNWSYILDYWLWRGSPVGYHCTNILIHSLSGFLLFLLLRRLMPGLGAKAVAKDATHGSIIALLVALVWTVHPVHNAAVAYISGRADSLAALFALTAWLFLLRALESAAAGTPATPSSDLARSAVWKRMLFGILAAGSMLISLCSKEIALIWLLLIVVHLLVFERRLPWRTKGLALAGAAGIFGLYAVLHALPGYRAPMEDGPPAPWDARILLMLRALGDYTSLLFYPGRLYMERSISNPAIYRTVAAWREHSRYEYLSILGLLAGLGAILGCAKAAPGRAWRVFGVVWFVLAFLPISNLFPLNAEVAEHWIYLASIGFFIFLAGVVVALPGRVQKLGGWLAMLAIIAFTARTAVRSGDWVDAETFCVRTIAAGGGTPRILNALASIYSQRGDYHRQEDILRKMMAQFPEYAPARMNLGICLSRQGRAAEAEALLGTTPAQASQVAKQYPRTWMAAAQLAQLRRDAGHPEEALAIVREARGRFPESWELIKAESELIRETAGPGAAIPLVENFVVAHWWHYDAQSTLGALRFAAGQPDAAIAAFRAASRLDIYDGRALAGVAEIENARGRPDVALEVQLEAMDRDPDQPKHYAELSAILEKLGRKEEAGAALRKAQALTVQARRGS